MSWNNIQAVTVKTAGGTLFEFDSVEEFVWWARRRRMQKEDFCASDSKMMSTLFALIYRLDCARTKHRNLNLPVDDTTVAVARDELGLVIPCWRIGELLNNVEDEPRKIAKWRRNYWRNQEGYGPDGKHFRKHTVPHTKCWKASKRFMWRHPKTTQEITANEKLKDDQRYYREEYGINIKGRTRNLPTAWDDLDYGNGWRIHPSWKLNRKTQWKNQQHNS